MVPFGGLREFLPMREVTNHVGFGSHFICEFNVISTIANVGSVHPARFLVERRSRLQISIKG